MLRTHTCGELRLGQEGTEVSLSGWVQRSRDLGGMTFIDLRDRYGITQLVFNMEEDEGLCGEARRLGREYVIKVTGLVRERSNKNPDMATGDIELKVKELEVLNASKVPPFTIEEETDGGEALRMQYRMLDLRRAPLKKNIELRHRMAMEVRRYMDQQRFLEIETPVLIRSTPEGARDFVVPSRMHSGQFYALPQSPQTFKQLLMVSGFDRYYQLVKCFRDEDLRADRQPEFTQIDAEMAFVDQEDVIREFEGLARHLFREVKDMEVDEFPRMTYAEAMKRYGTDRPDLRFGMAFVELNELVKGQGFKVFDNADLVVGICAEGCAGFSRKQLDGLTEFVTQPQVGAKGLVHVKYNEDGSFKSSVDKFFSEAQFKEWAEAFGARPGDLMLILAGKATTTRHALHELRLRMGGLLELRDPEVFAPLWVTDFPLLEEDEETGAWHPMHHPFTSPKDADIDLLESDPLSVRANAYDLVINGVEIGGGSIRIHDRKIQEKVFDVLGFTKEEAQEQFGFLMDSFEYGAPPHGGAAFGFDRWVALFAGHSDIRDFIAFPKNNAGRDVMIDAPASIPQEQLDELHIRVKAPEGASKGS